MSWLLSILSAQNKLVRHTLFVFLLLIRVVFCQAQQDKFVAYTVKDGLPSNLIYRCLEDNKGFLWIATDAGIARFDGKHFQVFTTKEGLPDNEVLAVVKEQNGRIWVNCFKQSPAYFDEVQNRFINAKNDSNLAKVSGTGSMNMYPLANGGVIYYNEKGSFIFRDKKIISYNSRRPDINFLVSDDVNGAQISLGQQQRTVKTGSVFKLIYRRGESCIDSILLNLSTGGYMNAATDDGKLYMFDGRGKCYIYSAIKTAPMSYQVDSLKLPEPFITFSFTKTSFYVLGLSGKIHVYNKKNFSKEYVTTGAYISNSYFNDSKGNVWISTVDKGLLVYRKNQLSGVRMPEQFTQTNFLSIASRQEALLAGNYYGNVLETRDDNHTIHTLSDKTPARIRKIIVSQDKVFCFSELGVYVDYQHPIINPVNNLPFSTKTAIAYNDSILLVGYSYGMLELNSRSEKIISTIVTKRITALSKNNFGNVYFGSTDGLYKYNYRDRSAKALYSEIPELSERVVALCSSSDDLLWMATADNGIVVIKDDKIFSKITMNEGLISNSCRCLTAGRPGQLWIGTSQGLTLLNYKLEGNKFIYTVQNLSANDGITNNVINEMIYHNDTIFAATSDGISRIPAGITVPDFDIPVEIIQVSINQKDTFIAKKYNLDAGQRNILIRFAGVELGGHFKNIQYTLDRNKNWISLTENTLNLQLDHGDHTLQVRAIDVNGMISNQIRTIYFNIATPFWKTFWFWLLIGVAVQALTIYAAIRWQKKRKQVRLAKEIAIVQTASLEQQAFTSLMNPHFMFNALNSIQHYINVQDRQKANRYLSDFASLIRKNFEAAQQSFIPLEQELENIKIYLRLEQMRFADRFSYSIYVDENVDTDNRMIPTMMLQPLLENAILHGIMPSTLNGNLAISITELNENLCITITDNGVGLANSQALKPQNGHKSHGMELIKKRVSALCHFISEPITIEMAPAFQSQANPGNKVTLCIPAGLYAAWQKVQFNNVNL